MGFNGDFKSATFKTLFRLFSLIFQLLNRINLSILLRHHLYITHWYIWVILYMGYNLYYSYIYIYRERNIYIYIYIYIYICIYIYTYIYLYIYIYCAYLYIYIYIYKQTSVCTYLYVGEW